MNTTLLRYPGGKSKALKQIIEYIPKNINCLFSPFFGGGSVEIALNNQGVKILGYDLFEPLVNFWNMVINHPKELSTEILKYYPLSKEQFYEYQKNIDNYKDNKIKYASIYYVLNRCSFSGSTLSGGMSPGCKRFTLKGIENVMKSDFKNLYVKCLHFEESFKIHQKEFAYIDPPYLIKDNLYGKRGNMHKDFNHHSLNKILKNRSNWILSYNDCEEIRNMYNEFKIIPLEWKYGMGKEKKSNEILIINI